MRKIATTLKVRTRRTSTDRGKVVEKEEPRREEKEELKKKQEKPVDIWPGENAAKSFVDYLSVIRFKNEYEEISTIPVDQKLCKEFYNNMKRNRSNKYPIYDSNRVKPSSAHGFVNATKLTIPKFPKTVILAQIPINDEPGAVEDFWKMVFEEQTSLIYILATKDEPKKNYGDFFPTNMGEFSEYGTMWINNRKCEDLKAQNCVQFIMEVLPKDCSNSLLCTVDFDPIKKNNKILRFVSITTGQK